MAEKQGEASVQVRQTADARRKPVRGRFPGPADAAGPLRVAIGKAAYAEICAHARETLDTEVCGILAGTVGIDDAGRFVHVKAVIRGAATRQGSTHVTFTQETWTQVHRCMEKDHKDLEILGWYHSHPGFGVEFSEMDTFIHRNFFGADTQIALVTDPVGGDVAICRNDEKGVQAIERFWVDGREHRCRASGGEAKAAAADAGPSGADVAARLERVEQRLTQALQALDEHRQSNYRLATFTATIIGVAIVGYITWLVYSQLTRSYTPPKIQGYVQVPVMIDGKPMMVGMAVVSWEVPPDLNAAIVQVERERREALERAATTQSADGPAAETEPVK